MIQRRGNRILKGATIKGKNRPPDKSVHLKIISQPKHMLWVLKRTVSMRRFF